LHPNRAARIPKNTLVSQKKIARRGAI